MEVGTKAEQKLQLLSPGVNRNPDLPKGNQVITLMKCTGAFFFFWLHLSNSVCYVIQSLSPVCLFGTQWTTARQASLFFTISQSLLKLKSIELVGDAIQPSHPLLPLLLLPSIFPSIRVFSNELALPIRWPKYWSFSFSLSNEYSGLISFRIEWFDLLAVQQSFKSLLQDHSPKASVLWRSVFLWSNSHIRSCYWKNQASTIRTFVSK